MWMREGGEKRGWGWGWEGKRGNTDRGERERYIG